MRWKIHKLGFLNFWLYDEEEFLLEDGHILLRGSNASGKSITTQSFIPFILDGNRRPERLDPFGSRDRKMDFYLLGDGEREESIGYLYLEFRKSEIEEYRTIGIGMRAQQGKGVTGFWGFCLADGRRIGPGGLVLCQRAEGQKLPLTARQLRDRIHDPNRWAETPEEYKAIVNREIFGFQDIREYDQLIQILMKVRAPKLSKDAMRPTEVKTILRESLQVLTDADLSAMIATMERMDQLEDTLADYQAAMQDVQIIVNEYNRYNQYMLGVKGQSYLEARSGARKQRKKLSDQEGEIQSVQMELSQLREQKEETGRLLELAQERRKAMGEDDLSRQKKQLDDLRKSCNQRREDLDKAAATLSDLRRKAAEKGAALEAARRRAEAAASELRQAAAEMDAVNRILGLGEEHREYLRILEQGETVPAGLEEEDSLCEALGQEEASRQEKQARDALLQALKERRGRIRTGLQKFQELEYAQKAYDAFCEQLDRAEQANREAEEALKDAEEQEREEQSRLTEALARWRQENRELCLTPEEWVSLRGELLRYSGPADWGRVQTIVDTCFRRRGDTLQAERVRKEADFHALEEKARETRREHSRILRETDPIPPRRDAVQAARGLLAMRNIPCAAFYETIDFAPDCSREERSRLEAQLSDAGLLDALLVPEEAMGELQEVLAEYPDCFLLPGTAVAEPVSGLIPEERSRFRREAAACLRGISGVDGEAETALLPDGSFRCGILRGRSHPEGPACYVGAEARRENRERLLRQLEETIREQETQLKETQAALDRLAASLETLAEERRRMPDTDDWNHAIAMRQEAEQARNRAEKERQEAERQEAAAKQVVSSLERELREHGAGLPYGLTKPAWEEADGAAEDYQAAYSQAAQAAAGLRAAKSAEESARDTLDLQVRWTEDKEQSIKAVQRQLEMEQAQAEAIQAELDRPENRERAHRLEVLEQEMDRLARENRTASEACIRLEQEQGHLEAAAEETRALLRAAEELEEECGAYFSEDLRLGFSELREEEGLEVCAKSAVAAIPASARGHTPEEMGDALRRNFQNHNNSLLKYHAESRILFDPPKNRSLPRQRLSIVLRMSGRELSLYGFAKALQKNLDEARVLLEKQDRELFENILMDTVSHKLRGRIEGSRQWAEQMTEIMSTLDTSMGLTFSLDWKPLEAEDGGEMDTVELVRLLNRDRNLLSAGDSERVSRHFRARVKRLRDEAYIRGDSLSYAELIRKALDYRNWYAFRLFYRREGEGRKELTDRVFNRFSGGEKAMAMYVPLFASVSAHYRKAREDAPLALALDEAFAGVDEKNIAAMFDLLRVLDFDYIMNSQSLWGCYASVNRLNIAELHRPANASVVTVLRYFWNGRKLETEDLP